MWKKQKFPKALLVLLLAGCLLLGYYIGAIFCYPERSLRTIDVILKDVMEHPLKNYWNENSPACIGLGFLLWLFLLSYYSYYQRDFHSSIEHGSAEWADIAQVLKRRGEKDGKNIRILSQHVSVSKNKRKLSNNNMMVVGAPGTGKSAKIVAPNLLLAEDSMVILDVKGDLLKQYGNYLKEKGYRIKVLDLISSDFGKSNQYNPFMYVKTEVDLTRLVLALQAAVTPADAQKGEPFWEDGVTLYLMACFYYVWLEMEHPTLNKVLELMNRESHVLNEETQETELSVMMDQLARDTIQNPLGDQHPAVIQYRKLKEGAPDTVRSIVIMCNSKLKFCQVAAAKRIFEDDEMDLQFLGSGFCRDQKTRTALFLCVPDDDKSFNFVVGMLYTQLFQVLIREARKYGGALPVPVEIWMDEFANGARPDNFEELITTLRSRNISVVMFLQSVSQLKKIYPHDTWEILMDACSVFVYLGGGRAALSTHEYISKLLGQATIDKKSDGLSRGSHGSGSLNFDRLGRELMTPAEVGMMPEDDCIILITGEKPIYDKKYYTFDKENFKKAMALGVYEHDVCVTEDGRGGYITQKAPGRFISIPEEETVSIKCKKIYL